MVMLKRIILFFRDINWIFMGEMKCLGVVLKYFINKLKRENYY